MEKSEKRMRLSIEKQHELLGKFVSEQGESEFGVKELNDWFEQFGWYSKLPEKTKESRVSRFISTMKKMYGDKFRTTSHHGGGHVSMWRISDKQLEEKLKTREEKGNEKFKWLYLLVRKAYDSKLGVSKKDATQILNYETRSLSNHGLVSVNNRFERFTGFRLFQMEKSRFTNCDIITVDREIASMIIEEYHKDFGDLEVPVSENDYDTEVKAIIKKDYQTLLMFKKSGKVIFRGGEAEKFRRHVIGAETMSADKVAEKYQKILETRYGIELEIIGTPKKGFEILSKDDLKDSLIKIENIYAEYFCEDIVPSERTERKKETKRELEPTDQEKSMLGVIERDIFKGQDGCMYLSDLWKTFDNLGIKRGWDLLGLLKKNPDKFKIDQKDHSGYTEAYIRYTAPIILPTTTPDIPEKIELKKEENLSQQKEKDEKKKEVVKVSEFQIYFGFKDEKDLIELCKNPSCERIDDDGEYYMCVFFATDGMDKKTMLSLLRLCYIAEEVSDKVKMIYYNKNMFVKFLEWSILNN